MAKNITVLDENGNIIGSTYPKRAEGLVKHGRAEYVGDCMIKMKAAHSPHDEIKTEEQQMSKIIGFDPRKFGFDKSCRSNAGQRAFMTTTLGNTEVWEIGDYDKHRTQLISKMKLQRYTDYVFRFAMTGGHNEDGTEISQVNIFPENRWDDRMTYALEKSRYAPVISKRDKTGLLRVFELPFNTGDAEDWSIVILQERAPARFFAPLENSAYNMLGNMTYEQWLAENGRRKGLFGRDTGKEQSFGFELPEFSIGGSAFKKLIDMAKQGFDVDKIVDKAKQGFDIDSVIEQVKQGIDPDGTMFGYGSSKPDYVDNGDEPAKGFTTGRNGESFVNDGVTLTESELAEKLVQVGSGCNFRLNGSKVTSSADRSFMMIGNTSAGSNFRFIDTEMTAYALSMLLAKVGDGSNVVLENVTVTDEGLGMMIDADNECGGVIYTLKGVTLPKQALDLVYSKVKNGSTITAENISATFTQPKEKVFDEAPRQDIPPKTETPPRQDNSGFYFSDMIKSTLENAAEGFNTFGEMMRRAEKDINHVIDDALNDKPKDKPDEGPADEDKKE